MDNKAPGQRSNVAIRLGQMLQEMRGDSFERLVEMKRDIGTRPQWMQDMLRCWLAVSIIVNVLAASIELVILTLLYSRRLNRLSSPDQPIDPPRIDSLLLLFMSDEDIEHQLNMREVYRDRIKSEPKQHVDGWYRKEVASSLFHLGLAWVARHAERLLGEWVRDFFFRMIR